MGTEPGGEPQSITSDSISVSIPSVALMPGLTTQVDVTVLTQAGFRLTVSGLSEGLRATFEPEVVQKGTTKSTLTLAANWESPPGETVLTIGAAGNNGNGTAQALQTSATLRVNVGSCTGAAIPSNCPPFLTGGERFVSGVVLERTRTGTRPAAGVNVWAWVQNPEYGYIREHFQTNAWGEYSFSLPQGPQVLLQTESSVYDHPCASLVELSGSNHRADIEVVRSADPIVDEEPEPSALVGVVYETTPQGRRPVAGARVYVELMVGLVAATTTTDSQGRYSLCRLPSVNSYITAWKFGYFDAEETVPVEGVTTLDIEMKRGSP